MIGDREPYYGLYYIPILIGRAIGGALKAFGDAYYNAVGQGPRRASVAEQLARQRLRITIGWLVVVFGFFAVGMRNPGVGWLAWGLGILTLTWQSRWMHPVLRAIFYLFSVTAFEVLWFGAGDKRPHCSRLLANRFFGMVSERRT